MKMRSLGRYVGTGLVVASASCASRAAVIFTEDFEAAGTGTPAGWTLNNDPLVAVQSAPPSAPPDAPGSTKSFVNPDGLVTRISKAFTPNASATSLKLTWYQYLSNTSATQRAVGQLSTGTAAVPGTGTGTFFRWGTNNNANWTYIYSNGSTQTVNSSIPIATGTPGWHKMEMSIIPGAAGSGSFSLRVDGGSPINVTSTAVVVAPNVVTLGNGFSNGATGSPDTTDWFDSVVLEQFAAAAGAVSSPTPASGATDVSVDQDLSWVAGANATAYDVYLSTDSGNLGSPVSTANTTYDPGTLLAGTTYFWRVDPKNVLGDVGGQGSVFSFTTAAGVPEPGSALFVGVGLAGLARRRRRA
jgi:hypothetical protein